MANTASNEAMNPIASVDLSSELVLTEIDLPVSDADGQVYEIERALADSLATFQDLRGKLVDRQVLKRQLAAVEDLAACQQQQIQILEQKLAAKQQTIDLQNHRYLERSQQFQQLFENFEVVVQSLRSELTQLKSYIWWQQKTSQTYHQYLYSSSTRDRLVTTARNGQVAAIESEIIAQRNLAGRLDIQLATANQHIADLYTYIGETGLAEKWLSEANQLPEQICTLRTEITTLHADLSQHTEALLGRVSSELSVPAAIPQHNFTAKLELLKQSPLPAPVTLDVPKFTRASTR